LKKLSLLISLLLFAELLFGQPYYFRRYQVEDGLSNNAVLCSLQDKDGFMWFGTKDGLSRFDGYSFKIYRNDTDDSRSLGGSFIHCLAEDRQGLLWVGTEQGLYSYNKSTENFTQLRNSKHKEIRTVLIDKDQNIWFISGLTLCRFDNKRKTIKEYPVSQYFYATALCQAGNGKIWVATTDGELAEYDHDRDNFSRYSVFEKSPRSTSRGIERIHDAGNNHILVGTSNQGVKYFDINTHQYKDILSRTDDKTEIYARTFLKQSENTFWVGTETGIYILNLETGRYTNLKKQYNDPYSLSDNAIYFLSKDHEGGVWICTYFGGINYYPKQYSVFEKFYHKIGENSISGNAVREITPDNKNNLWIGTEDAGLNKLDPASGKVDNYRPDGTKTGISHTNLHGLFADGNELWIGTFEHGLDVMDLNTKKVIRHYSIGAGPNQLKSNFVYCIYKTRAGQILIATTRGLYSYNRKADNFDVVSQAPDYIFYTGLIEDSEGTIWLATIRDGLYYYNRQKQTQGYYKNDPKNKKSLVDNRVNRIFEDSEKKIWVATEAGLCKFNKHTHDFDRYTIKDGFPGNVIYGMLEDAYKNLWISTSKGLLRFNPKTGALKNFTKSDGLLSDQFNYSSAYKDPSGRMYFGSVKGLIRFNPADFKPDSFKPPVFITGIQVNNQELLIGTKGSPLKKSILLTDKVLFKHTQSTFSIDFAALSYTSPVMTEYAYKMDGIDKDWTYLKQNRKAYFTDLSPGEYTFRVKASNSSGIWNTRETTLNIVILPPWWASKLAFSLYILAAGLLIYILVKRDHKRIERRNARRMEVFENEKEKEIYHAKIEFFTNIAHEIRSPLTLIKGPMEKMIRRANDIPDMEKNLKVMNKNTDRLLELTNQLLDFRKTETRGFSLNFVKTDVSEALRDIANRFQPIAEQKQISYTIQIPEVNLFAYIDLEAFHKIVSNLIDNGLKYCESSIKIELEETKEGDNQFTIRVISDGKPISHEISEKIFEPFFRARETDIKPGTGIGLSLSRALAELHNGSLTLQQPSADFNIFVLRLPVHQLIEFNLNTKWKKI
jgi:ligand-binding sensor domain-containing protein/signal transduction histidine kinase